MRDLDPIDDCASESAWRPQNPVNQIATDSAHYKASR
jgi:hypothetical protein